MADVIAICNQKGGVGKTTTAINLASCLAAAEKRTLLIDMDSQGNATTGLGFDKHAMTKTIYHVLTDLVPIRDAMQGTAISYLKLIPSSTSLVGAEVELVSVVSRETRLKRHLALIEAEFDYIVMDCPPSLGLLTLNALTAANGVIVPVQCEYFALEGLADLSRTIALVKNHLNPSLDIRGIVMTMFDGRVNLSRQVQEELRNHFQGKVFTTIIPRNVRLSEAPSYGKPIILYDVESKGAQSYLELAKEVISRPTGNDSKVVHRVNDRSMIEPSSTSIETSH